MIIFILYTQFYKTDDETKKKTSEFQRVETFWNVSCNDLYIRSIAN